jgi:predicted nuclease with TOPRIM domain
VATAAKAMANAASLASTIETMNNMANNRAIQIEDDIKRKSKVDNEEALLEENQALRKENKALREEIEKLEAIVSDLQGQLDALQQQQQQQSLDKIIQSHHTIR